MTRRVAAELPQDIRQRYGEIAGFICGDGSLGVRTCGISFANSEPVCINRMLENFSFVFHKTPADFHYYLTTPATTSEADAIEFWTSKLPHNKIRRRGHWKIKKKFGCVKITLSDRKIKEKIKCEIEKTLSGEEVDESILLGFLRGFFAAEGTIVPGKIRKEIPNAVQFPQKGRGVPNAIKRILAKFEVDSRVVIKQRKADYFCANVTGFENYLRLSELGIVSMHPEKNEKMKLGLVSYKKKVTRKLYLPLKILSELKKKPRTRKELYRSMKSYPQRINGLLYAKTSFLVKNRLILKENTEEGTILWHITKRGEEALKMRDSGCHESIN